MIRSDVLALKRLAERGLRQIPLDRPRTRTKVANAPAT